MRHRLYIVTRRTPMFGESVVGIYRDPDMAGLHLATIDLWGNAKGHVYHMDGPWWWWFRGPRFLAARVREEYQYLDWSVDDEDPAPAP